MTASTARDLRLVALTFSSGAVDAISFLALGKVFTAFMTGNLVFLGIGAADVGGPNVPRAVAALLSFAAAAYLATRVINGWRSSGTWPGYMPVVLGAGTIAQAGFLGLWLAVSGDPSGGTAMVLVVLSAFAMGMQSGAVMSLRVEGVFTTAATATLLYLMRGLPKPSEAAGSQRRLAGVLVALVTGAAAGALLLEHARTLAPALPLVVSTMVVASGLMAPRSRRIEQRGRPIAVR